MAKIRFGFIYRAIDIDEQRNAEAERYHELCKQRLPGIPRSWELLTANSEYQSFNDHGPVRTFDVRTGKEIDA